MIVRFFRIRCKSDSETVTLEIASHFLNADLVKTITRICDVKLSRWAFSDEGDRAIERYHRTNGARRPEKFSQRSAENPVSRPCQTKSIGRAGKQIATVRQRREMAEVSKCAIGSINRWGDSHVK
jgi:hypothetical protein